MAISVAPPGEVGRVLVVDDEPFVASAMCRMLERAGYRAEDVLNATEAIERLRGRSFDAILSDVSMPGLDGLALLERVRHIDPELPVILFTGAATMDQALDALHNRAFGFLQKPTRPETLVDLVGRAISQRRRGRKLESGEYPSLGELGLAPELLSARLDAAIRSVFLAYQPVVSWSRRRAVGYEALARSAEPTLEAPRDLFAAAERLGAVARLGREIWTRCVEDLPHIPEDRYVMVNLHAQDLADDHLVDPGGPIVRIAPRAVFEITERAPLDRIPGAIVRIAQLRAFGARIAIDDIGSGYGGLTSFVKLRPDVIKLDMTLVRDIDSDTRKQQAVRHLVDLCGDFGIEMVAEGVETFSERNALIELGCDLYQGFVVAPPGWPFRAPRNLV